MATQHRRMLEADTTEKELRESIINKFTGYMLDLIKAVDKEQACRDATVDQLALNVKWEDVFFHLMRNQADTNPNFATFRHAAAHNPANVMTDEEDKYFWDLNDARHMTLAKQVAKEVQKRLK